MNFNGFKFIFNAFIAKYKKVFMTESFHANLSIARSALQRLRPARHSSCVPLPAVVVELIRRVHLLSLTLACCILPYIWNARINRSFKLNVFELDEMALFVPWKQTIKHEINFNIWHS